MELQFQKETTKPLKGHKAASKTHKSVLHTGQQLSVHAVSSSDRLWFPNTFEIQDTIAKMYSFLDSV